MSDKRAVLAIIGLILVAGVVWAGPEINAPPEVMEAAQELAQAYNTLVAINASDEISSDVLTEALEAGCTILRTLSSEPLMGLYMAVNNDGQVNYESVFSDDALSVLYTIGVEENAASYAQADAREYADIIQQVQQQNPEFLGRRYRQWPGALQTTHIFVCTTSGCPEEWKIETNEKRKQFVEALLKTGSGAILMVGGFLIPGAGGAAVLGAGLAIDGVFRFFF